MAVEAVSLLASDALTKGRNRPNETIVSMLATEDPPSPPLIKHKELMLDGESRNKLRERRLRDLSSKPLSMNNMRQLFRLLDMDGSQEVSPSEIQRGLVLLGFEAANDPAVLSRLLLDIDEDKTGTVTEAEFLAFFSGNISRASLKERLNSYTIGRACIKATIYGTLNGKPFVETEDIDPKDLQGVLSKLNTFRKQGEPHPKLWLDVVGFDEKAHSKLAHMIGISADELRETVLLQDPTVSAIPGHSSRTRIICHTQTASCSPLRRTRRGIVDLLPFPLSTVYSIITGAVQKACDVEIVPNAVITRNQPSISIEQASIIVADDSTVVTLRVPNFRPGEDSTRFRTATALPEQDSLMNDGSILNDAYNEIREQMNHASPYVEHIFESSIKDLAIIIVDTILNQNNRLYDSMQDWLEAILLDVKQGVSSRQTSHIASFLAMQKSVCSNIEPLQLALNPTEWSEPERAESEDEPSTQMVSDPPDICLPEENEEILPGCVPSASLAPTNCSSPDSSANKAPLLSSASVEGNKATNLASFFEGQLSEFLEMSSNLKSIANNMEAKKSKIEDTVRLIDAKKSDMMNTTLYALTLITTLTIPMAFLTGLFGMNFADMYELYPAGSDPAVIGVPDYVQPPLPIVGYQLFWTVLGVVEGLIILFMLRFRLFDALW